jgi:hypothetical protein
MSLIAFVTVTVFGFLMLAPVVAAFALRPRPESSPSNCVVPFPARQNSEKVKHRRQIDAA